ncbi:MAG: hypothetical protein DMG37_13465 [Acidobacteria bacterium]|nr:MAG: hypothetical protein DMG37_13465 [Acidobacteriota bacterium]
MPGIVGLITRMPRQRAEQELLHMVEALRHEDFYVAGTWIDESLGVYVGWVARKGSFAEGMPLCNESGDVTLVFSGEEFPEPSTAQQLRKRGHDVDSSGPSYLVHLYEDDESFPVGLNGRFHGLLADRNQGKAVLFNDRYGMHRLYYHESRDAFYFAAEAKAILAVNASLKEKAAYFHPREWESQEKLQPEAYYQALREAFSRNLPRYFGGDQRIGMSLTGGLDTRMIAAWQKSAPGDLPCYTFGSMVRDNHDVRVARRVAKACNQPFQVLPVGEEFLARFPYYAERAVYLTDGCVDVGRAPDLYLNEKAREIAPVRMTGNYGGEILRGLRAFKPEDRVPGLFSPEFLGHVHRVKETYDGLTQGHPASFAAFKQCPWHHYGILALEQTQLSLRSPYVDNELVRTVFRAPDSALANDGVSLRLISDGNPALARIPTDRGVGGKRNRLVGKASRALLEFQFMAEYAYDMGMPQWVARIDHAFSPLHLERLFLGRHKVFHFRVWYRDALASYVKETLLDPRSLSRPYLERNGLEAIVRGHLKGDQNYTNELHKVLTLELVHRIFLENQGRSGERRVPETPLTAAQVT